MIRLNKPRKLSVKLVLSLAVILIALNLVVTLCMTFLIGSGMNGKQNDFLEQSTSNAKRQVEQFVDKYKAVARILAQNPQMQKMLKESSAGSPASAAEEFQDVTAALKAAMASCPDILGIGYGSVAENRLYTQSGSRLDVKLTDRAYYSAASRETYVTQPYVDMATGEMCVSIATPVSYGEKLAGVLIVDLKLTQVSDFLDQMSFGESGRMILLAEDNTVMGSENHDQLGRSVQDIGFPESFLKSWLSPQAELSLTS